MATATRYTVQGLDMRSGKWITLLATTDPVAAVTVTVYSSWDGPMRMLENGQHVPQCDAY